MTKGQFSERDFRVLVLAIHPAPYRDATFARLLSMREWRVSFVALYRRDAGHSYQGLPGAGSLYGDAGWGVPLGSLGTLHPRVVASIRQWRPRVTVIPGYSQPTALASLVATMRARIPYVFVTDSVASIRKRSVLGPVRDRIERLIVRKAGAIWVPGKATAAHVVNVGASPQRVFQGAYCLDSEHLAEIGHEQSRVRLGTRAALGLRESAFVFLFVGRMIRERGLGYLIAAFSRLVEAAPHARLLLVGDGPERRGILNAAAELGVADLVRFLPPMRIDEVGALYCASDAYVLPSVAETYSLALAHAAILGLPIIATDHVGAVDDYVVEGETGTIVRAGAVDELSRRMLEMAVDPRAASEMGRRAAILAKHRSVSWAAAELESAILCARASVPPQRTTARSAA